MYNCISTYKNVEDPENWLNCPNCGLKPKIWVFDNGRSTGCGCGNNDYDHFSIHAESIMSVVSRSKSGRDLTEYDSNELKENWNHWVKTGEEKFLRAGLRIDGKW